MRIILLILTVSLGISSANAQDIWSLKRCLEYAQETNIALRQAELNTQSSQIALAQSKAARLPNLNAGVNGGTNFGYTINPFTNTFETLSVQSLNAGVNSGVTIFNGFRLNNSIKQSKIDLQASELDQKQAEYDLALNVTLAYLNILRSAEIVQSASLQVNSTKEQRDRTNKLVQAGSLAQADLLQLESQIATDELQLTNAQNQLQMAYLTLQQLLRIAPNQSFGIEKPTLDDPELELLAANPDEIYRLAESTQPFIESAELNVKSAGLGIEIAKSGAMPSLTASGNVNTRYVAGLMSEFGSQMRDNFGGSVFLNLNFPIFNRRQNKSAVQRADLFLQNAQFNSDLQKQLLEQTIQQAFLDAKSAYSSYSSTLKQVEALELTFKNTEKQLNLGVANSTEYLLATNNLNRARNDLVRTKFDYIFRTKVLDFYQGKPLGL